jgi:rod shape-determining protein MreC
MAIYTVGRRRVIFALLLTSVLLLTLDLRGNAVLDRVRDGFVRIMEPIESATDVVTTPASQAWKGITEYDDLERENQSLQDQLDRLAGTEAAFRLGAEESKELRALLGLPSLASIPTVVARVVGASSNNLDQIIEIDQGSNSGFRVGMPVVNQAGLIGKITRVTPNTSRVMLITDARYTVAVRVQAAPDADVGPVDTSPTGKTNDELLDLATTTTGPSTTLVTDVLDTGTVLPQTDLPPPLDIPEPLEEVVTDPAAPGDAVVPAVDPGAEPIDGAADDSVDGSGVEVATTTTTTTTTIPELAIKEFGGLEGRGHNLLPQIRFLQDVPNLAVLQPGDIVVTAGGFSSLAPEGIPVGVVINRADRSGSAGPLLDIDPYADVTRLNFVRVVKYTPLSEVEQ